MLYFKNSDLAYTHHVSVRTVRNWIEAAKQGKLDLDLHTHAGRQYVSNTARNLSTIERMVEDRKKYRPHRAVKVVTPKPGFYHLYNEAQIYDIVSNLEIHHEIPRDYNYFDGGAGNWDKYAHRMASEDNPNNLNSTIKLLKLSRDYIDSLISSYKSVNIVDIGVGNGLPVKELIEYLLSKGKLGRYVAIDISPEMLAIAKRNVEEWFGDSVDIETYDFDINHDRFANVLAEDYIKNGGAKVGNIILFLGGTIQNFRKPDTALSVIHDSMSKNDLLIHTQKLDTPSSRRFFDFGTTPGDATLAPNHRLIFDLLNIDSSFYTVEMGFDEPRAERYIRVRLKVALTIDFKFEAGHRPISFNKDDSILLWRAWQNSYLEVIKQFSRNDLYVLHNSQTDDQEYLLTISRIRRSN